MSGTWIPVFILGGPFVGLLLLSAIYRGGSSAAGLAYDSEPRSADLETISRLSGPISAGAISRLSGPVSPGAISALSGRRSPGAIAALSGPKSPGAISRLSGPVSPGAISRLSAPRPPRTIARLSAGFYVSNLFGLPLLTRSQAPLEPQDSLLMPGQKPRT